MRIPRVRFKLWGMMIVVAVAAIGAWGQRLSRISAAYTERAAGFRARSETPIGCALPARDPVTKEPNWGPVRALYAAENRRRDYWREMAAKYERAARYPWLPVKPDPPEPEWRKR